MGHYDSCYEADHQRRLEQEEKDLDQQIAANIGMLRTLAEKRFVKDVLINLKERMNFDKMIITICAGTFKTK